MSVVPMTTGSIMRHTMHLTCVSEAIARVIPGTGIHSIRKLQDQTLQVIASQQDNLKEGTFKSRSGKVTKLLATVISYITEI